MSLPAVSLPITPAVIVPFSVFARRLPVISNPELSRLKYFDCIPTTSAFIKISETLLVDCIPNIACLLPTAVTIDVHAMPSLTDCDIDANSVVTYISFSLSESITSV